MVARSNYNNNVSVRNIGPTALLSDTGLLAVYHLIIGRNSWVIVQQFAKSTVFVYTSLKVGHYRGAEFLPVVVIYVFLHGVFQYRLKMTTFLACYSTQSRQQLRHSLTGELFSLRTHQVSSLLVSFVY